MSYQPPFTISLTILTLSQNIFRELGKLSGAKLDVTPIRLRRENRIKTIQASLAIEGNTLNLEQVSAIWEGRKVLGPKKDILEVSNAIELYNQISLLDPLSQKDLLKAHSILLGNIEKEIGRWRTGSVGIFKGKEITHIAPPSDRVPLLMDDLFYYISTQNDISWLLKACIFHYEFEFIHPFIDGNGRLGRLWQQLLLMKEDPVFEYISVEALIKEHQKDYYRILGECDKEGNSTRFIEFSLSLILQELKSLSQSTTYSMKDAPARLQYASLEIEGAYFSRKEYQLIHKEISSSTASRDLLFGLANKILIKKGNKNQTLYRFI